MEDRRVSDLPGISILKQLYLPSLGRSTRLILPIARLIGTKMDAMFHLMAQDKSSLIHSPLLCTSLPKAACSKS
jgi:hypothetical protein